MPHRWATFQVASNINWNQWHRDYHDPASPLFHRLQVVQHQLRAALDGCPAGRVRLISLCAGQGLDVLGVLEHHPRRGDVLARLVERDPRNVAAARALAQTAGLTERIELVAGDASNTSAYRGLVPADVVVVCGVFGNITAADIERTIRALPSLCAPRAAVVWTRHQAAPDLTPAIRGWFHQADFEELGFQTVGGVYGVGAHRFAGAPQPFQPNVRLFEFIGYDRLGGRQR